MRVSIRPARPDDLPGIARLAGELVRLHYAFDPRRFLLVDDVEAGYARFFQRELESAKALLLAVEAEGDIVGYSYARLEARDWNALLDEHAALHDIFVAEAARGSGVGERLLQLTLAELRKKGAKLVILHTATANTAAQRLFAKAGFRVSMLEMSATLD